MAQQHIFYAVVIPGLEKLAAAELESLSAHDISIETGGVNFSGTMQLMYRVNLRSRTITRVLMRLRTFRSMTLEGLGFDLKKVAWHLFFDEYTELDVQVNCRRSRLNHSGEISEFAKTEIKRNLPKIGTFDGQKHQQTLHIHIDNNRGILSLDTSGDRLDRRGYRLESGKAPLRETLAAAILQWAGWIPEQVLLAPMCGSGTFPIEAAMMANKLAPNLNHDFFVLHWPSFKQKEFQKVFERCQQMKSDVQTQIFASDLNSGALEICKNNAQRASVENMIEVSQLDIHSLTKPETTKGGLLIINPPYGHRIGERQPVLSLWHDLGEVIRNQFNDDISWKTVIVCPDQECEKALKLKVKRRLQVSHGGNPVAVLEI